MRNVFKNFICSFLSIYLIMTAFSFCLADDYNEDNIAIDVSSEITETIAQTTKTLEPSSINSRSCIVFDRNSHMTLYGKNENNKVKMASTTKIMTSIIIIENCNLSETIEISKKAAGTGGSRLGLKTGDKITINDLLYGLMLCSGNDAAVALAEYAGGDIQGFADMMNKKAIELGLINTHFESPHGLDSDGHYTTAYELALLSDYALKNETFSKIVGTKNYTVSINGYSKNLSNTNELLGYLNGVYGVKTGFTNGANRCLVTACKRGDMDIICVVLGADTKKFRTQDSIKLIEFAFENFTYVDANEIASNAFESWKVENLDFLDINKSSSDSDSFEFEVRNCEEPILSINKNEINNIKTSISINSNLEAPITSDTIVGKLILTLDNQELLSLDIINARDISRKDISYYIKYFFSNYSNILEKILY